MSLSSIPRVSLILRRMSSGGTIPIFDDQPSGVAGSTSKSGAVCITSEALRADRQAWRCCLHASRPAVMDTMDKDLAEGPVHVWCRCCRRSLQACTASEAVAFG
eukprot:CAMPEP_0181413884 /NCGR_PEP_ID=MMETSP1110-20121109/9210_1 /TAXON_ID=174948 /ORGANISM="Symbiodinium sp., Strain CCMP421" /LENGTH=103 /DNA_ID=CAMNT_0023536727 /DNA_START=788 /DNA_END=1099 /DNA_ORIENTATION=+